MKQEELIERYKEKDFENDINRYNGPARYFKTSREFYKDLQDGVADETNYFENTNVMYEECEKPKRKPDYVSDSGSCYWYLKKGVIRGSNHWGNAVANCDWAYKHASGKITYGHNYKSFHFFDHYLYGFARWDEFLFKARLVEINGKEVLTSFNNTNGRDLVHIDGKQYIRKVIEVFEEVK